MSEERFKVVFSGQLLDGFDQANVKRQFAHRFRAPEALVERVFGGGTVVIKKELEQATAVRLNALLGQLGMQSGLQSMAPLIPTDHLSLVVEEDEDLPASAVSQQDGPSIPERNGQARDACPKCGSKKIQSDECQSCGVIVSKYLEIQAQLSEAQQDAEQSERREDQQRALDLGTGMSNKQAFQASWKAVAPIILVLVIGWRWYSRFVPDAYSEAEIKEGYVEACYEYEECMQTLDSQWDQCFAEADYSLYSDATASRLLAEEDAFFDRLDQCLVDEDGEAIFY